MKQEPEKWKSKWVELEVHLEQANNYAHSLEGDVDVLHAEVFTLRSELMQAHEVNVQNDFELTLLKSETDSGQA